MNLKETVIGIAMMIHSLLIAVFICVVIFACAAMEIAGSVFHRQDRPILERVFVDGLENAALYHQVL